MTSGERQGLSLEIVQTRGTSMAEALAIFKAQVRDYKVRRASTRYRVGRTVALLPCLALLALVLADCAGWTPGLPPLAMLAAYVLLVFASIRLLIRSYYRNCAELYHDGYKADRRFRIERDTLIITHASGVIHSIPWTAIDDIVAHDGMLAVYFGSVQSSCLLKSAHENQDVESFCSELTRRWQAHRTPAGAPA